MPTYIRSKTNIATVPSEIIIDSEGTVTILTEEDHTFRLPGVDSNGVGGLRVANSRIEVKLSNNEWKQITVASDLSTVATTGLFSDLLSIPTTVSGYGITDAYTKTQVDTGISTAINNLVDGAPDLLNTLNELSKALNDDSNFAATVTTLLNGKLSLTGGTMTGALILDTDPSDALGAATKQYVDSATASVAIDTNTTDDLVEGTNNLYYTDARARSAISVDGSGSYNSATGVITVTGGVTSVNTKTGAVTLKTVDIAEDTNLYYTDARTRSAVSAGTGIIYNNLTGVISVDTDVISTKAYVDGQIAHVSLNVDNLIDSVGSYMMSNAVTTATLMEAVNSIVVASTVASTDYSLARTAISAGSGLSYDSSTGIMSLSSTATIDGGSIVFDGTSAGSGGGSNDSNSTYSVPTATTLTLGLVKVDGSTITITEDGTITALAASFNGSYDSLTNKPSIPAAQVQSDWNATSGLGKILNKPNLSTVATSGSYTDLTNKPSIPAAQVQSDWNATSGLGHILNKPNLATVATSGRYDDLIGSPLPYELPKTTTSRLGGVRVDGTTITVTDGTISGFDGDYNNLTNKPTAYVLPNASTTTLGGVQVDGTSIIANNGVISVASSYALKTYVDTQIASIINSAPAALNSLNELSQALGNDANFATTIAISLGNKLNTADFTSTADTWLTTKSTNNLTEGTNNKYYTDSRVGSYLTANGYTTKSYVDGQVATVISSIESGPIRSVVNSFSDFTTTTLPNIITALGKLTWDNLTGKPTFATVATSGSYNDLTNKPTIPSITGLATETYVTTRGYLTSVDYSIITNKPTLVTSYNQLTDKPTLVTSYNQLTDKPIGSVNIGTLTIGTGLSGTSYNGATAVTIANTGILSITGTAPVSASTTSGATTISMAAASASANGYMTSTYAAKLDGIAAGATNVTNTNQLTNGAGYITGITSANVTTALGFTPYNATNPNGYIVASSNTSGTHTGAVSTSSACATGGLTVTGAITATGEVTAYYSDARLKNKVEPIIDPIAKVMALRGVTFRPNQTALDLGIIDKEEVGVIAQEVETVLPQLVVDSGYQGYKTVKYDKLTALLIEAVKNQQGQIDELKQEIKRLKND
jgi:hypothetical protein